MHSLSQRLNRLQQTKRVEPPPWPAQREAFQQGFAKADPALSADEIEELLCELDGLRAKFDQCGPHPHATGDVWLSGYVEDMSDSLIRAMLAVGRMLYGNQP